MKSAKSAASILQNQNSGSIYEQIFQPDHISKLHANLKKNGTIKPEEKDWYDDPGEGFLVI